MKSNHQLSFDQEVKALGTGYINWKVKVDNGTTLNVTSEQLITMISSDNMLITRVGNSILFKAVIPGPKPNKIIVDSTYDILASDKDKWLIFTVNCTVTAPTGLTTPNIFEGEAYTGATVTFQAASGVNLRHVASISKTLSPNGVFGIRAKATNDYILYGTDPVNYLA